MDNKTLGIVLLVVAGVVALVARLRASAPAPVQNTGTVTIEPLVNVGPAACRADEVMISGGICIPARREDTGLPVFGAPGTTPSNPGMFFFQPIVDPSTALVF